MLVAIVITGCSEASQPPRDTAMEAATARMSIAIGADVPGNRQYLTLGKVRAHCMENPQASCVTATEIFADDDDLQQAAYREVGSEVELLLMPTYFMSAITIGGPRYYTMRATSNVRAPQSIFSGSKQHE